MSSQLETKVITLLVLGDGDFSYSLDLARYLALGAPKEYADSPLHLIATGLDARESLMAKYKDSNFILAKLMGMDGKHSLRVSIHHDTSAIQPFHRPHNLPPARHLIFHHPHLGTEDAQKHSQFLCHLFHSVSNVWLPPGGYFHLTLAQGQYRRWGCQEAAQRHQMVLVDQRPFRPPPVDRPCYRHRRHQCGKSFAARSPSSVFYTFVSKSHGDGTHHREAIAALVTHLFGMELPMGPESNENPGFSCPHCNKQFGEKRSRECHIKAVHGDGDIGRQGPEENADPCCTLCPVKDPETGGMGHRRFPNLRSLNDHMLARHGKHGDIKPDWYKPPGPPPVSGPHFGTCEICGTNFWTLEERNGHEASFLPADVAAPGSRSESIAFPCCYCQKQFRDQRAQKQHENFCPSSIPKMSSSPSKQASNG